jgi:hypothetical protein
MNQRLLAISATVLLFSAVALADDTYQVRYAANLNIGDSFVDFTNTGATVSAGVPENLCANVYTFDPGEELISCCTCAVTPNGLQSLSVLHSLISNTLTPAIPTSVVIKVVVTPQLNGCNASGTAITPVAHGMLVWGTTLHQNTSVAAATYQVTEAPFSFADLSTAEVTHLATTCGFIQSDGSGFGICSGCSAGGLGALAAQ